MFLIDNPLSCCLEKINRGKRCQQVNKLFWNSPMINNSKNLFKFNHTFPLFCASSKFDFIVNMNRSSSKVHTFLMFCVCFSKDFNKTLWLSLHLYACNAFITIFHWFRCKAKQKVFISWSAAWIIAHDSYQEQAICHVIKIKSVKAINHKFCKEVVFQNMNGNRKTAVSTRQENNGRNNRYGYECTEERDYFPYWHPSPWKVEKEQLYSSSFEYS